MLQPLVLRWFFPKDLTRILVLKFDRLVSKTTSKPLQHKKMDSNSSQHRHFVKKHMKTCPVWNNIAIISATLIKNLYIIITVYRELVHWDTFKEAVKFFIRSPCWQKRLQIKNKYIKIGGHMRTHCRDKPPSCVRIYTQGQYASWWMWSGFRHKSVL